MHQQIKRASLKTWLRPKSSLRLAAKLLVVGVLVAVMGTLWDGGQAATVATTTTTPKPQIRRCDVRFNTYTYNRTSIKTRLITDRRVVAPVNFSLDQWANAFKGRLPKAHVLSQLAAQPLYREQILGGALTDTLLPDVWAPMYTPSQCATLRNQLQTARNTAARYPTAAYAKADGYVRTNNYFGGVGVHYQHTNRANLPFDPGRPAQILYDGTGPNAPVVGLSYFVYSAGTTPPEGFMGKNDRWLRHNNWCLNSAGILIAADVLDAGRCAAQHGTFVVNPGWWTLHVWLVPGCESDWGVFSLANPSLPYMSPAGANRGPGCGTGRAVTSPLNLDRFQGDPRYTIY